MRNLRCGPLVARNVLSCTFSERGNMQGTITFTNWKKYNARTDGRPSSWVRLEHHFMDNPDFMNFSPEEKFVFVYLLCYASRKNGKPIPYAPDHYHRTQLGDVTAYKSAIQKLKRLRILELRSGHGRFTDGPLRTNETNERTETNETNERNTLGQSHADARAVTESLELRVYAKYPRKLKKAQGLKRLTAAVKHGATIEEIEIALGRFLEYHRRKGTEADYIPHFSTWVSSWRDWLDEQTGTEGGMKADPFSFFNKPEYQTMTDEEFSNAE